MTTIEASSNLAQPISLVGRLWHRSGTFLIVSTLFGLVSLNVLTLLNDAVHAAGYGALRAVLASVLPDAALSRMLRDSPTTNRKSEIEKATKRLVRENADLIASNKAIEKRRLALELANKKIAAEHAALKSVAKQRVLAVRRISKGLARRSLANATRNVSAVAGEAVPFVGTAIIVGVTLWDVRDACQTMKDVNELNSAFGQEKEDHAKVCGMTVPSREQVLAQIKANWKTAYKSAEDAISSAGDATAPKVPTQPVPVSRQQ